MRIVDREHAEHYNWKTVCDGWHFVKSDEQRIRRSCRVHGGFDAQISRG